VPGDAILSAALRYLLFALLAIVGPGIALQRLLRVRAERALVLPLGLACCALTYWLSLVTDASWVFVAITAALDASLLLRRVEWAEGPSARGALPAFLGVALCFAVSVWRQDRLDASGAFVAGALQADDAAFQAGLAYELALGWPPQVPGLSGFTLSYHLGAHLVRAAALRFANVHPYDALSRFDNTLYALALILALRAAVAALEGSRLAVALAGFSVLASDLSFLMAPGKGIQWWVGLFEGGTFLQSLFHANSLVPALALALGALVALRRHFAGEGRGFLVLAALASLACPFFKVFVAAHFLAALWIAFVVSYERMALAALAVAAGLGLVPLALGDGASTMLIAFEPLRVLNDSRADLGLAPVSGLASVVWLLPWLLIAVGLRLAGARRALQALFTCKPAPAALAAFALSGYVLGLVFRISPVEGGARERPFNEALYFFESSGAVLWVFAALAVAGAASAATPPLRALLVSGAALLSLPSTLQYVWQERSAETRRVPPALVRALGELQRATRPGEVVLVKPERQRHPPAPMLIGRRVPFTRFIPFFAQLAPRAELVARYERTALFFTTPDAALARAIAHELGARTLLLVGNEDVVFDKRGTLQLLYGGESASVWRITPGPPPPPR
jgi:hypothetical protein